MFKARIKLIVLKELSKDSLSGYDLMKRIECFGKKPSPGYIYPLLKDLKEKGFISFKKYKRKKVYSITNKGKKLLVNLQKNREDMIKRMRYVLKPIADKDEIKEIRFYKHKRFFKDKEVLVKFHKTLFSACKKDGGKYKDKIKTIINDSIRKLEKLK
jgi:DNA-binding PadR family transcriptional regulator